MAFPNRESWLGIGALCVALTSCQSAPGDAGAGPLAAASGASVTASRDDDFEAREAQRIDSLVALGRIGEAHSAAMLFVQHYPTGPLSMHVVNLMGVHPRPAGAVPEPLAADGK